METINFNLADVNFKLPAKRNIRTLLKKIFKEEGEQLESLSIVFCSDGYLLKINREYLKHDYFTDIITFDLSNSKLIEGELYISLERVKENSKTLQVPYIVEIQRVIIHGALHLCGYKDKTPSQIKKIRNKEDYYLKKLHVSRET